MRRLFLLVGGLFLLLCLSGCAFERPARQYEYGNTKGNIQENGYIVESDGWIYYTNHNDNDFLYRCRADGGENERLTTNRAYEINALGGWIYYVNGSPGKVYRIKPDGSENEALLDQKSRNLIVTDQYIFCIKSLDEDWNKLYRLDVGGGGKEVICDSVAEFAVDGSEIYYTNENDNYSLHSMDVNGNNDRKINSDYSRCINVVEDKIYYSNHSDNDRLYSVNKDGSGRSVVSYDSCWNINIYNGIVYYRNQSRGGGLHKMNLDGSEDVELANGNVSYINATDNLILYYQITEDSGYYAMHI